MDWCVDLGNSINITNFIRTRDREVPKKVSTFHVMFTLNIILLYSVSCQLTSPLFYWR